MPENNENNGSNEVCVGTYKLRVAGERGFSITVFPKWVEENGLQLGDDIDVIRKPNDSSLILRPAPKKETVH